MNRERLWRGAPRLLLPAVLLLSLALYLPSYAWAFIGDDYVQFGYIRELVEMPAAFPRVFDPTWSRWYYRPLQNLWLLALRLGFGLTSFPYYYLQGLWHLLATALLYALARRLRLARPFALGAAALFALNARHQDVVGWVSSVATPLVVVFSFAAMLAFVVAGRARRERGRRPGLAAGAWPLFTLLALFSHESGVLLPPFLLLVALSCPRRRPGRAYLTLGALLLAALGLGAIHLLRPNLTLAVSETPPGAYLDVGALATFLALVLGRWTLLTRTGWGTALLNGMLAGPAVLLLPLGLLLLVGWLALTFARDARQAGGRGRGAAIRLPLAWSTLHLLFGYGALYVQAPDLLGGRHLYAAWAGVSLLLAGAAQAGLRQLERRAGPQRAPAAAALLAGALLAFLLANGVYARAAEAEWLAHAREVAAVEAQMKARLPAVSMDTAIYTRDFVLTPAFAPYAAAVWYGQTGLEGGSLDRLRAAGALGPESYLFDLEGERLRELLPALHDYAATFLLWPEAPPVQPAGPEGEARLALPADGGTVTVTTTVPAGNSFYTAFHGPAGSRYRVRAVTGGEESVLAAGQVAGDTAGWQVIERPLPRFWTRETRFVLEAEAGAWSLPRLVRPAGGG